MQLVWLCALQGRKRDAAHERLRLLQIPLLHGDCDVCADNGVVEVDQVHSWRRVKDNATQLLRLRRKRVLH